MTLLGARDPAETPRQQAGDRLDEPKGTQAVERVLNILEAFSVHEPELTASELGRRLNLHKSTVHRLASVLEARGFLERNPHTRAYRLGPGLLRYVEFFLGRKDLASISVPHMRRVWDATNESIGLHLRVGTQRVCIMQLESSHELRMRLEIGKALPLYCGAASKVLLAEMSPDEVSSIIQETGLKPLGPGSIREPERLIEDLRQVRERGYAVSREERIAGGITVAAPVRDAAGAAVASVSIYGPLLRVDEQCVERWISLITETAAAISTEMGFQKAQPKNQKSHDQRRGREEADESRRQNRAPKGRGGVP